MAFRYIFQMLFCQKDLYFEPEFLRGGDVRLRDSQKSYLDKLSYFIELDDSAKKKPSFKNYSKKYMKKIPDIYEI